MNFQEWRQWAKCKGMDPNIFHPARGDYEAERRARAICRECPVRGDCRDHALSAPEPEGFWAGLSIRQREKILGKRLSSTGAGRTIGQRSAKIDSAREVEVDSSSASWVLEVASRVFRVDVVELVGDSQMQPLVTYRLIAMAAAREVTHQSFPVLGRLFGNRDHTTILSACRRVEGDARLRAARDRLVADLGGGGCHIGEPPLNLIREAL